MPFIDITGKDPMVPECPEHKGVALKEEFRTVRQGKRGGYWRCPKDDKVYIKSDALTPR